MEHSYLEAKNTRAQLLSAKNTRTQLFSAKKYCDPAIKCQKILGHSYIFRGKKYWCTNILWHQLLNFRGKNTGAQLFRGNKI